MRSPSPPAGGRSRWDCWLESSPSFAGSAGLRPLSFLQALYSTHRRRRRPANPPHHRPCALPCAPRSAGLLSPLVVSDRCFLLLFSPWSCSREAAPVKAHFLVSIEITGIPDHVWHLSSAEFLVSPFCRVENLAPETRDASDMLVFSLTAWTTNPDGIPRSSELLVAEPDAVDDEADGKAELPVLDHAPVQIHASRPLPLRTSPSGRR
ncbi:hypothetical protein ZWY2020_035896 [Hordeum vulgare]|nr:hypothetical protein ZWY2020_035896 [Hordeum vulgare]